MKQEDFDAGVVANALGPDLKGAGGGLDGNELDAASEGVVTVSVVEVVGGRLLGLGGGEEESREGKEGQEWDDACHGSPVLNWVPRLAYSLAVPG